MNVGRLLERAARLRPDHPALVVGEGSSSYARPALQMMPYAQSFLFGTRDHGERRDAFSRRSEN